MTDKELALIRLAQADFKVQKLVNNIQAVLAKDVLNLTTLKLSLIDLLKYLSSEQGCTNVNCCAVDSFFMFDDLWVEKNLPESFHDLFSCMADALHDTVSAPEIAKLCESTPEQLLEKARKLLI